MAWNLVPATTKKEEILASRAPLKFSAETTLKEKVKRVFNICLFAGVAAVKLSRISGYLPVVAKMAAAQPLIYNIALALVIRKVLAVVVSHIVYIATIPSYVEKFDRNRLGAFIFLQGNKFTCRRIALNKSGFNYDSFAVEHNPKAPWALLAGGNGWIGEGCIYPMANEFKKMGFNILFVNGPGVARSSGFPSSYSMGAAQEAGLEMLETVVKAKKILLYGTSLGGGAQAEAICRHDFKKDVKYMVWSDRSFDKLSNAASKMVLSIAKPLFYILGVELDGVAGAKRLKELKITHLVTQNYKGKIEGDTLPYEGDLVDSGSDGVIPNAASLYTGLRRAGIVDKERIKFFGSPELCHNGWETEGFVSKEISQFVSA